MTSPTQDVETAPPRRGDVAERIFGGLAVSHHPTSERYHCMAYPCPNTTVWFYLPAWSHLCMECMAEREMRSSTKE